MYQKLFKTPVDICPRPSDVVFLMIKGLKEHKSLGVDVVKMSTYGARSKSGICAGCAATCTLLASGQLEGKDLFDTFGVSRSFSYGHPKYQMVTLWQRFESAINTLREGSLRDLLRDIYGIPFEGYFAFAARSLEHTIYVITGSKESLDDKNLYRWHKFGLALKALEDDLWDHRFDIPDPSPYDPSPDETTNDEESDEESIQKTSYEIFSYEVFTDETHDDFGNPYN